MENEQLAVSLSHPAKGQEPLEISGFENDFLIKLLHSLKLIRKVEEKLAFEKENGSIGGPVHLGAGQEAIAVGISSNLKPEDRVFGAHRSHSHLLALNPDFKSLFAEVLGKDSGFSKGMGGSMHLSDPESGFAGSVPIVSGTVPLALGAAFDSKFKAKDYIGVAYIGDGAMEEGVVHESLNLAKVMNLPVLFVVENNLFSSHMHISLRQPKISTTRFASANNVDSKIVDGNDVIKIFNESKKMISSIRKGNGPQFLEAITYRHFGHVDYRRDIDVGVNRSQKDLLNWMKRDPITRLESSMLQNSITTKNEQLEYESNLDKKIDNAWVSAVNDPYPNEEELLKRVFKA